MTAPSTCFLASMLVLALARPAPAGGVVRVSVGTDGTQADAACLESAISSTGRYCAFLSKATSLDPGDTNGVTDVFLHDRKKGVTSRVSVGSDGAQADAPCESVAISGDGRVVAFASASATLVAGDTNGTWDVFVHDRKTGVTSRVSVNTDGVQGNHHSLYPALSHDGRFVAFVSTATNLVLGDTNGASDVFVRDRKTGVTTRVSVSSSGGQGTGGYCFSPSLSANGRYVAFSTNNVGLVPDDTNLVNDVFVHDRKKGLTTRVSVSSTGVQANANVVACRISANGRVVVFDSAATSLAPGDQGGYVDVFAHDRKSGTTTRVSVSSAGFEADFHCSLPSVSASGRFVSFCSQATNLVAGAGDGVVHVYVRDRKKGTTALVSGGGPDGTTGGSGWWPSISASGRYVAFESWSSDLVAGDTNGQADVFVRDRKP